MVGIIGGAPFASDVSMLLQVAVLIVLVTSIKFAREKNIKKHRKLTIVALVAGLIGVLFVMLPSFFVYLSAALAAVGGSSLVGIAPTLLHAILGIVALSMGILFAFNKKPMNVKRWMRVLILLWASVFVIGVVLYLQIAGFL